jgi:hypothetical protein
VRNFLLSHPSHQKELEPQPLVSIASLEEGVQVLSLIDLELLFHETRSIALFVDFDFVGLQEGDDTSEFVEDSAR